MNANRFSILGVGPQSLRGLPNGFSNAQSQPQPQPQSRSASSRIPNGKMGTSTVDIKGVAKLIEADCLHVAPNNSATWAFGGVPMGSAGLQNNTRPANTSMTSFAQSIGGSQNATPLDLSYVNLFRPLSFFGLCILLWKTWSATAGKT
jgi:CCR4-NOT transcription complex subunit 2